MFDLQYSDKEVYTERLMNIGKKVDFAAVFTDVTKRRGEPSQKKPQSIQLK